MFSPKAFSGWKWFTPNTLHPNSGSHTNIPGPPVDMFHLYFSCTSIKDMIFFFHFQIFHNCWEKESFLFWTHREQQELYQCHVLCGTTVTESALVKLHHIDEGFLYLSLYYKDLSILERWKHLIFYCLAIISCFPRLPCNLSLCNPPTLHVQHLLHLLIIGSIVPDNSAPARLQGGYVSPDHVSLLTTKTEELITFSSQ